MALITIYGWKGTSHHFRRQFRCLIVLRLRDGLSSNSTCSICCGFVNKSNKWGFNFSRECKIIYTPCSKKGATKLMVITSSNLNRLQTFSPLERGTNLQQNLYITFHHTLVMLPHYLSEFVANLEGNANKKYHLNQLSFHSYWKISHGQTLNLPAL